MAASRVRSVKVVVAIVVAVLVPVVFFCVILIPPHLRAQREKDDRAAVEQLVTEFFADLRAGKVQAAVALTDYRYDGSPQQRFLTDDLYRHVEDRPGSVRIDKVQSFDQIDRGRYSVSVSYRLGGRDVQQLLSVRKAATGDTFTIQSSDNATGKPLGMDVTEVRWLPEGTTCRYAGVDVTPTIAALTPRAKKPLQGRYVLPVLGVATLQLTCIAPATPEQPIEVELQNPDMAVVPYGVESIDPYSPLVAYLRQHDLLRAHLG